MRRRLLSCNFVTTADGSLRTNNANDLMGCFYLHQIDEKHACICVYAQMTPIEKHSKLSIVSIFKAVVIRTRE